MNKQDRQNKTILKREREKFWLPARPRVLPLPMWLWEKVLPRAESGAVWDLMHHTSWAQERSEEGMPRARGKQTSEFCTISLLNAGPKFSEQSWVLGGQCGWQRLRTVDAGLLGPLAHEHTHLAATEGFQLVSYSFVASFRVWGHYTAGYYWEPIAFWPRFSVGNRRAQWALPFVCSYSSWVWEATASQTRAGARLGAEEDQTSEPHNTSKTEQIFKNNAWLRDLPPDTFFSGVYAMNISLLFDQCHIERPRGGTQFI